MGGQGYHRVMEPHPDYPEPQNVIEPCPRCGTEPDFTGKPLGSYRYVGLPDGSVVCQLAQPLDPNIIPYLSGPVFVHACGPVVDRAQMVEAAMKPGIVVAGAEEVAKQAARRL